MRKRPNILWLCTDQQRFDTIHALGNPHIRTPNIDRLCREGVAFTRAYSQSPVCTPSRASFMTGLYPSAVHVNTNGNIRYPGRAPLLSKLLADQGYDCGLVGKLHIASCWERLEARTDDGYRVFVHSHSCSWGLPELNEYGQWLLSQGHALEDALQAKVVDGKTVYTGHRPDCPVELHHAVWCADRAIDFLREEREGPWLMSLNWFDPHPPFDAPLAYAQRYDPDALPAPVHGPRDAENQRLLEESFFQRPYAAPGPQQQRNKAAYYGSIELIDEQVGRLLAVLEEMGQREDTVVIFMSDHGEALGDHGLNAKGCRFYEGNVHVPLILSWPGVFRQDVRYEGLTELTDLAPTLAALAGIRLPWQHGYDLTPILTGQSEATAHRPYVRCEYYDALHMNAPFRPEEGDPTFATMHRDSRYKLIVHHGRPYGELYDLQEDPDELVNLWDDGLHAQVQAALVKQAFDATVRAGDPGEPLLGRY